jgi:hypothetical protein
MALADPDGYFAEIDEAERHANGARPANDPGRQDLPPFDLEAEDQVVGGLLYDASALPALVARGLSPQIFSESRRWMIEAVVALQPAGAPTNVVAVAGWLKDHGRLEQVGGAAALTEVLSSVPAYTPRQLSHFLDRVLDASRRRAIIVSAQRALARARAGKPIEDIARDLETEIVSARGESGNIRALVQFIDHDDLFAPVPKADLLVASLGITPGPPTGVFGASYVGKSIIVMAGGMSIGLGRDFWGLYSVRRGPWSHFDHEQGRRRTKTLVQRLAAGFGVTQEDLRGWIRVAVYPPLNLTTAGAVDHYARAFDGCAVATLDALKGLTPGVDENSSQMRDHMGVLAQASEKTGCTAILLHNAGKTPTDGNRPRKEAGRGSSAIFDECASVFILTGKKGEPAYVTHEKDRELGTEVADFGLRIENVPTDDGNPMGGLRVVHLDREQMRPKGDDAARFAKVVAAVLECVRGKPGVAGAEAIRELIGGTANGVRAAVNTLIADGQIVERKPHGKGRGRRLYLSHLAPVEGDA